MRSLATYALLSLLSLNVLAQKENRITKGTVGFEFMAGYLNSTPVGVYARQIRDDIKVRENFPGYSGSLLPKSSAYVGILVDYRFHEKVGIGSGMVYTPKGWWFFENYSSFDRKIKTYNTVDYFEFPIFVQVYPHRLISFRAGPVFSFAGITKTRVVTIDNGVKETEKFRFGQRGTPLAKTMVPGLEFDLNIGNPSGFHGTIGVQYSGSFYEHIDIKPVMVRLGFGYTLVK